MTLITFRQFLQRYLKQILKHYVVKFALHEENAAVVKKKEILEKGAGKKWTHLAKMHRKKKPTFPVCLSLPFLMLQKINVHQIPPPLLLVAYLHNIRLLPAPNQRTKTLKQKWPTMHQKMHR